MPGNIIHLPVCRSSVRESAIDSSRPYGVRGETGRTPQRKSGDCQRCEKIAVSGEACGLLLAKPETTQLLLQLVEGDRSAGERLFSLLYDELRGRARLEFRREHAGHTWQPTELVHEAFVRMIDQRRARWESRAHFCAVASLVMRRILVDHAREKQAERHGRDWRRTNLRAAELQVSPTRIDDVLLVDQLIAELEAADPKQGRIVQMRFFGGLTVPEVAEVLGVSKRSIEAEWTMIRAILRSRVASR